MFSLDPKQKGTVKFYNPIKGFGYIYADKEKKDVFFHITAIKGANPPKIGDKVSFFIEENKGRESARNIDIINIVEKAHFNDSANRIPKSLQGFPCIRGETINGFKVNRIIKKMETSGFNTVDEAKEALIAMAKQSGANAIFNYIWHRESDLEDEYFLIWYQGKTRVTCFWAEGTAVQLVPT
jgi:CspA family cold shock protein